MRTIVMAAALMCIVTGAQAFGKIAADPNAPGARTVQKDQEVKADKRLEQKVTYSAKGKTVTAILNDLSGLTEITFKAGYNDGDWQVRDRRMNIFAKDIPLSSLMNSMARVMKFQWSRKGDEGAWIYRFYMDRRALLDAENQRLREDEREEKAHAKQVEDMLNGFIGLENLSEQDLAKLKSDNPYLYITATSGMGPALGRFFASVPAISEALATRQPLRLNAASLPPEAQQNLTSLVQGFDRLVSGLKGIDSGDVISSLTTDMAGLIVSINTDMESSAPGSLSRLIVGDISLIGKGDANLRMDMPAPDSQVARVVGKMLLAAKEENISMEELNQEVQTQLPQAIAADVKQFATGEAVVEQPDDPSLHVKVKVKPEGKSLANVQEALAGASGLAVVSDSFEKRNDLDGLFNIPGDETELKVVLDGIRDNYLYGWEKHGSTIEFRDRNWYRKRCAQIPEAWLETWRETLKSTGTLEISELSQIAMLTQEQYNINVHGDEIISRTDLDSAIYVYRDLLRVYASLDSNQRTMILSNEGLSLAGVTPHQYPQIERLITLRNSVFLQNPDAVVTITGTRKQQDKQAEYTFTITSSDANLKPLNWKFTTPKYVEPKKDPKVEGK